jgi:hypothetical protein
MGKAAAAAIHATIRVNQRVLDADDDQESLPSPRGARLLRGAFFVELRITWLSLRFCHHHKWTDIGY